MKEITNCGLLNFSGCQDTYSYYNAIRGTIFYFLWLGVIVLVPILLVIFYILKSRTMDQSEKDKYSSWIKYTLLTPVIALLLNIIINLIFSNFVK